MHHVLENVTSHFVFLQSTVVQQKPYAKAWYCSSDIEKGPQFLTYPTNSLTHNSNPFPANSANPNEG